MIGSLQTRVKICRNHKTGANRGSTDNFGGNEIFTWITVVYLILYQHNDIVVL